jgi:membrane protein
VLFGTQLAFSHQNEHAFEFERDCMDASHNFRMLVSLEIVSFIAKRFSRAELPLSAREISDQLDVPFKLVSAILSDLARTRIVTEIRKADCRSVVYEPARDINSLTIKSVMDALDNSGVNDVPLGQTSEIKSISAALKSFNETLSRSPENKLLKDL